MDRKDFFIMYCMAVAAVTGIAYLVAQIIGGKNV